MHKISGQVSFMSAIRGDVLCFERAQPAPEPSCLSRTVSTYGLSNLEFFPVKDEPYVVCSRFDNLMEVASVKDPERPIGWELIYQSGTYYARVAQYGFDPVELRVTGIGRANEVPKPKTVGSVIKFIKMQYEEPQMATIEDTNYEEEDEVMSKFVGRGEETNLKKVDRERHLRTFLSKEFSYDEVRELFV
jgi:hypothetical protein